MINSADGLRYCLVSELPGHRLRAAALANEAYLRLIAFFRLGSGQQGLSAALRILASGVVIAGPGALLFIEP